MPFLSCILSPLSELAFPLGEFYSYLVQLLPQLRAKGSKTVNAIAKPQMLACLVVFQCVHYFSPFDLDISALLSVLNIILLDLTSDFNTATTQFFLTSQVSASLSSFTTVYFYSRAEILFHSAYFNSLQFSFFTEALVFSTMHTISNGRSPTASFLI